MRKATIALVCVVALMLSPAAWAQGGASDAQVEQLQKQLAEMQKQMAAMQKALEQSNLSAPQRQSMMGHMGMMQQGWNGMHDQCCMMNPGTCPHIGMGMPQNQ